MLIQSSSGSQTKKHIFIDEGKDTAWDVQTTGITEVHHFKNLILKQDKGKRSGTNPCNLGGGREIRECEGGKSHPANGLKGRITHRAATHRDAEICRVLNRSKQEVATKLTSSVYTTKCIYLFPQKASKSSKKSSAASSICLSAERFRTSFIGSRSHSEV